MKLTNSKRQVHAMIQIDEPFLSTGVANLGTAKKALKIVTEDLEVPVSMHVCGDVGEVLRDILKFPVQIIDCEFAGIPSNIDSLEDEYPWIQKNRVWMHRHQKGRCRKIGSCCKSHKEGS